MMTRSLVLGAVAAVALLLGTTTQAVAGDRCHSHGYYGYYGGYGGYGGYGVGFGTAPRVVYVPPPRVRYVPPPVVYAPPPAYVVPPPYVGYGYGYGYGYGPYSGIGVSTRNFGLWLGR